MTTVMSDAMTKETVKMWRIPELGNVELLRATYRTQTFSRHSHQGFALGVIERGALGFHYRGEHVVAPAGAVNLANPDEPHTGHAAAEEGWTYRMYYFDAPVLQQAASRLADRRVGIPFFQSGVLQDDHLAATILQLHADIEAGDLTCIEAQSRFLRLLNHLISRHADAPHAARPFSPEPGRIRRARDLIHSRYQENLSLDELSAAVGLSSYHFLRVFQDAVGLPPHAYLTQVRIGMAKSLLDAGWTVAAAATETGFVDQSHLTRTFKRLTGITPGQYRKIVQDG